MRKSHGSLRTPTNSKLNQPKSHQTSSVSNSINFVEELKILDNQMSPNTKYDIRINGIRRLLALIDHGALQNKEFYNHLPTFHQGIISSIVNAHNSSTKIASVLVSKLAVNLREQFEMMGNLIKPLSVQIAHRSQMIVECCSEALYTIAECCSTEQIMVQFGALCISRVPKIRNVASICFFKIVSSSSQKVIEDCWHLLSNSLRILLSDPNKDIHTNSRESIKHLSIIAPHLYEEMKPFLDSRVRKQIINEQSDIQKPKDIISKISRQSHSNQSDDRDSRTSEESSFSIDTFQLTVSNDSLNNSPSIEKDAFEETNNQPKPDKEIEIEDTKKPVYSLNPIDKSKIQPKVEQNQDQSAQMHNPSISLNQARSLNTIKSVDNSKSQNSPRPQGRGINRAISVSVSHFDNFTQLKPTNGTKLSKLNNGSRIDLISPHLPCYRSPSVYDPSKFKITSVNLSIRQSNGHGRNFLNTIREMIEQGDTDAISTNIKNVVEDVIKCCSLPLLSVSAISVLALLLPLYSKEFELKLNQIIPMLLNASSKGSNRASDNSMKILEDLPNYYSAALLSHGTSHSYSSIRLLNYTCYLVDLEKSKDVEQMSLPTDEKAIFSFLRIALESYQIDLKKSAHIIDVIYQLNDKITMKFLAELSDKWRYKCQKHFQNILPHITFPPFRPIIIPSFDPSSLEDISNYVRHFIRLIESLHSFQLKIVHSDIFIQINKMMLLKSHCPPVIFTLTKNLLLQRGFDDIEEILPGLLKNLRNEQNSKGSQDILLLFCRFSDILLVFAEFEEMMMFNDVEIQLNAIDFASVIIRGTAKQSLLPILPELSSTLTELLGNKIPEIRKAVVFCYVSLFTVLGHDIMEQYTTDLQPAQLKLIMIYLDRLEQDKSS